MLLPFAPSARLSEITFQREPTIVSCLAGCAGFTARPHLNTWLSWDSAAFSLLTPVRTLIEPARVIFQANQTWPVLALGWTRLLWALIVWSLVGGALCRMNALQFAARKRISLRAAFGFSRRQLLSYLVAPILPLSAVLILYGFNALLGCAASLAPTVGSIALGIGWGIVLFTGFLMAMLTLGLALGWPLMIAAISAEDSDGFDGLSRTFGYLFDRPWHAGLFAVSGFSVFAVSRVLIATLVGLAISLTVSFRLGRHSQLNPAGVIASQLEAVLTEGRRFDWQNVVRGSGPVAWTLVPVLLYVGFGPSFFWSATTVSYFLLRKSDDGTPLDSVVDWPGKVESESLTATGNSLSETPPDSET